MSVAVSLTAGSMVADYFFVRIICDITIMKIAVGRFAKGAQVINHHLNRNPIP